MGGIIAPDPALTDLALDTFPEAHLGEDGRLIFPKTIAYADLRKFCYENRQAHGKIGWISAELEVPGLTIKNLPECASGDEIRKELSALGFTLEAGDIAAFEAWEKELEEID